MEQNFSLLRTVERKNEINQTFGYFLRLTIFSSTVMWRMSHRC